MLYVIYVIYIIYIENCIHRDTSPHRYMQGHWLVLQYMLLSYNRISEVTLHHTIRPCVT